MAARGRRRVLTLAGAALVVGATTLAAGPARAVPFSNALVLDGSDDYASVDDAPSIDLGDGDGEDFTAETFLYVPNQNNDTMDDLFWKQGSWGLYVIYSTTIDDRLIFRLYTGPLPSSYVYLFANVSLTNGWHHVAAVFDNRANGDSASLYLDGEQVDWASGVDWTPGLPNSSSPLHIGAYSGVNPTAGGLDEARLSSSIRYTGSYTVPSSPFTPDGPTRALWHFNDPACSTTFADSSGNGNTATGHNGAMIGRPGAAAPKLRFSDDTYTVGEADGKATITVRRSGDPVPAVRVAYATSNGSASGNDYTATSGTLRFACGVTSKTFRVPITNDARPEPRETIDLTLSNPGGGASLGDPFAAVLRISRSDQ